MNHYSVWVCPILAIAAGLIGYFRSKDGKNAECWRCVYMGGVFILLWLLTFGGWPIR